MVALRDKRDSELLFGRELGPGDIVFHIVGVSHFAQMKDKGMKDTDAQKELRDCLEHALQQLEPDRVAEELSDYALEEIAKEKRVPQESVAKSVADSAGIAHRFCDPNDNERKAMGYVKGSEMIPELISSNETLSNEEINLRAYATEVAKHWPKREGFWIDRLKDVHGKTVVFVCGDAHIDGFRAR